MRRVVPSRPNDIDRRAFLRRAALIGAGVVAADQLELLDRLGWVRTLFAGWTAPAQGKIVLTNADFDALLRDIYLPVRLELARFLDVQSPLRASFGPKRLLPHPKAVRFEVRTGV